MLFLNSGSEYAETPCRHVNFSDIQEFYEITLLDDTKSIQQKTAETLQIASKWENSPPLTQNNESKYRYKEEDEVEVSGFKDIPELDGFPRNIVERAVQERFISSESPTPPRKVCRLLEHAIKPFFLDFVWENVFPFAVRGEKV
ncbi:hypothetical protein AVEN_106424-1 [Araneus ventricosus]|uniref:Uncharacterized protein n=1 Tax=Araneus ventricosus TaxID=182803 RepID=A0A4Y2ATT3_ARAVE|nr:hypothetical protein AVEN_106424-1 [Araneus ventricosus]